MWRTLKNAAIFDSGDEDKEKADHEEMKQGTSAKGEKTERIVSGTKHGKAKKTTRKTTSCKKLAVSDEGKENDYQDESTLAPRLVCINGRNTHCHVACTQQSAYSYHEQIVACITFHRHSIHLLGIPAQSPLPPPLFAAIFTIIQCRKGAQWLILGTLQSALLVIGLRFDISTPVNESLVAYPGAKVYQNYAKISGR